jgi:hypothetical protein
LLRRSSKRKRKGAQDIIGTKARKKGKYPSFPNHESKKDNGERKMRPRTKKMPKTPFNNR